MRRVVHHVLCNTDTHGMCLLGMRMKPYIAIRLAPVTHWSMEQVVVSSRHTAGGCFTSFHKLLLVDNTTQP